MGSIGASNIWTESGSRISWKRSGLPGDIKFDGNDGGLTINGPDENAGPHITFLNGNQRGGRIILTGESPGNYKLAIKGENTDRVSLSVAGAIECIPYSVIPDYVFEEGYKMRTLKELEGYINKNGHLPGVKSAKEIEKEGKVDLLVMINSLLEKIEELTLYTIEQQKRIEKMENIISSQSERSIEEKSYTN